jgi:hypothetical protein
MANDNVISAVGNSLERVLTAGFCRSAGQCPAKRRAPSFVRTGDLDSKIGGSSILRPSIYLYRADSVVVRSLRSLSSTPFLSRLVTADPLVGFASEHGINVSPLMNC